MTSIIIDTMWTGVDKESQIMIKLFSTLIQDPPNSNSVIDHYAAPS